MPDLDEQLRSFITIILVTPGSSNGATGEARAILFTRSGR